MKLIAVYLGENIQNLILEKKISQSIIEKFNKKLSAIFPEHEIISNFQYNESIRTLVATSETKFLKEAIKFLPNKLKEEIDQEYLIFCEGVFPILDVNLSKSLEERHNTYLSQYSYSENLPLGIVPKFVSREFIESLNPELSTSIHEYLLKNINQYETEIFFQEPDLRYYRLDFSLNSKRSLLLTERILEVNQSISYSEILPTILKEPKVFRNYPSYIELEIFKGCEFACFFCPRENLENKKEKLEIDHDLVEKISKEIQNFPIPVTICLGGLGEPLLHPKIDSIIKTILENTNVIELIIETALYEFPESLFEFLNKIEEKFRNKLTFIVHIPTIDENRYSKLSNGIIGAKDIIARMERLSEIISKKNIYAQTIKIQDYEDSVEFYYTEMEKKGFSVILQKYNTYAGKLPQRRSVNLTPIQREFCFHLAREVYVNVNGSVSICRNSVEKEIGSLVKESLFSIWENSLESFHASLLGNHDKTKAPCMDCDEWYSFNA
ncbi:MAG: spiro-SPASM protein [Leptospiraceae bacterium]|nr:spiro-SPASM protein [Leptospiraceae bacterium]